MSGDTEAESQPWGSLDYKQGELWVLSCIRFFAEQKHLPSHSVVIFLNQILTHSAYRLFALEID